METTATKLTAGLDGSITAEIYDLNGIAQDLTGCDILITFAYEYENIAVLTLPMVILGTNVCKVNLTPENTKPLDSGFYDIRLIIYDVLNKKHATSKIKFYIDKLVISNYTDEQFADMFDSEIDGGTF